VSFFFMVMVLLRTLKTSKRYATIPMAINPLKLKRSDAFGGTPKY
jgi:hypothetical protein